MATTEDRRQQSTPGAGEKGVHNQDTQTVIKMTKFNKTTFCGRHGLAVLILSLIPCSSLPGQITSILFVPTILFLPRYLLGINPSWSFFFVHYFFSSLFIFFLLKDNCFTEFGGFILSLNMNQPWVYIHPLAFEPVSHLPSHPTPLG